MDLNFKDCIEYGINFIEYGINLSLGIFIAYKAGVISYETENEKLEFSQHLKFNYWTDQDEEKTKLKNKIRRLEKVLNFNTFLFPPFI